MKPKSLFWIFALILLLTLAWSCGGDDDDDNNDQITPDDDDTDDDDDTGVDDDDNDTDDDITPDDDTADDDDDDTFAETLIAGVASGYLDAPVGLTMGGFGARKGPKTPYSQLMGGSVGYHDRPNVKAVSLMMNDQRIVFAKGTMPWPTETIRTMIVNIIRETTGVDLDRTLIISGTHTHSGPARFFVTPDLVGFIGMDTYSQEITDRLAISIANVIMEAMNNMQPAKIGFGAREQFDPTYRFATDRRCENGPGDFMENRLWVGQVEDLTGKTLAVLTGMAMHGVVYEEKYMTGDAPDGVERGIEAMYDYPVVAIYFQGSAGDATPRRSSDEGHRKEEIPQYLGYWIARIVREIQDEITLTDEPEMRVLTRRYTHDRETLGYQDGEFGFYNLYGRFQEFERGALECGVMAPAVFGSIVDCDDPDTTLVDGHLGCAVNIDWPIFDLAYEYLSQSPLTVAQIADTYFYTAPGEITAHLAVDIREQIAAELDVPFEKINTLGYAQNYIFYMTQDWDWWQGGFEVEGSLFGWRFGRWLTEEMGPMADELVNNYPPTYEDPEPKAYRIEEDPVAAELSENLGDIETQPAATAARFDTIDFAWHGGHPGVDNFTVTLQRRDGAEWIDLTRRNGAPYTDKGWEMMVILDPTPPYLGNLPRESRDFLYSVQWETNWDDPTGVLRLKVAGTAQTEDGPEPYEVISNPFTMNAAASVTLSDLSAQVDGDQIVIAVRAAYPAHPAGWRMRSPYAGGANPAIVSQGTATATVVLSDGAKATATLTFDDETRMLTGATDVIQAGQSHTISVDGATFDDGFANTSATGTLTTTVTP